MLIFIIPSGDGGFSVINLGAGKIEAITDSVDDEILSMAVIKVIFLFSFVLSFVLSFCFLSLSCLVLSCLSVCLVYLFT